MAKNLSSTRNANVVLALPVPAGTVSGEVLPIGADGLMGYTITERISNPDFTSERTYPHGVEDGEASVELVGISLVVRLAVGGAAVAVGDAVYRDAANSYTNSDGAGANTLVGWAVSATAAADEVAEVALKASA